MSNLTRLAPYAYMAKRSGAGTLYDLLLIVPVDATGDTDLSNVSPVKTRGNTRIAIDYTTTTNAANGLYRYKHWLIDAEGTTYLDVQIRGDNDPDLSMVLTFSLADTTPATVSNDKQTFAPYLFVKIETLNNQAHLLPSCIVLFENGLGAQNETLIFAPASCTKTIYLGNNNPTTDPTKFVINQNIKSVLTPNQEFIFEGNVAENTTYNTPPRKTKSKALWAV